MADVSEPLALSRKEPSERKASILLVDDTPANLLSLRAILEEPGQNLVEARSGEEALERIRVDEFAVVLLDVLMPGIGGFETAKRLRADERSGHTPIIFLTASDIDRNQTEEAYALGAVDFLVKPLLPVALRAKVRGFVELFQDKQRARREADQFRLLVQGATDYAIFLLDPQGHVASWNAGAERIKRYKAHEIIGQHFSRFYPQAALDRGWPAHELKVAAAEGRFEDEGWRVRKDGSQFWANVVITALKDERGNLLGFSKITRDLTARKQAEENARRLAEETAARQAAHEERERLRVTLASIGDAVISTDAQGRVTFLNPVAEALVGWGSGEAAGRSLEDVFRIVNEQTRQPVENPALRALKDGVIVGLANHTVLISKDGSERPIDDSAAPIRGQRGDISGSVLVFRDISERKRSEAALAERVRLLALNAAVGEALVQADTLGVMLQRCAGALVDHLHGAFARIWTLNPKEDVLELRASAGMYTHLDGPHSRVPVGRYKIGLIAQERKPHLTNGVVGDPRVSDQEWARREGMTAFAGYPLLVDDRLVGVMAMFARQPLSETTLEAMASVADEIAVGIERKVGEGRLHEQREWLAVTLASIGDAVIATDTQGRVTFLNAVAQALTGWAQADAEGRPLETVFSIINEQTRRPVENPVEKVLREGVIVGLANHTVLISKDGSERPIDDSAAPIRDSAGKLIGVVLTFRDVTEQRRAEQELRSSEARKSAILQTALDCIITMDHEGNVVEFNPAAEKTFGYRREQVIGQELCRFIIPPSLRDRHRTGMAHYLATGEGPVLGKRLELPALRADGTEFPVELAITRIPTDGPPVFTAYLRDITEAKRAEQHRNARLAVTQVLSSASDLRDGAGGVLRAVCESLAWDVGFFWRVNGGGDRLECLQNWHHPDVSVAEFEQASFARTFEKGEGLPGHVWSTGKPHWLLDVVRDGNFPRAASAAKYDLHSAFACPVVVGDRTLGVIEFFTRRTREPDADLLEMMGTVAGSVGQFTERKAAEDDLRRSEQELADFFENATVGLHWVGADGTILRANRAELDLLGYRREEYVGRPVADFHADEATICDILNRLQAGEELHEYPARLKCKDGSIKDVLIDSSVLFRDGHFVHTRCFTRDVTDRRRAERLLACQKQALEMVAEGTPLEAILDFLVRTIEAESTTGVIAAIHLLDESGGVFRQAVAPGLPDSYHRATRIAVHPDLGPCCRAVSTRGPVTVPDVAGDPQWAAFAGFAVPLGIRSGWSTPILSSEGRVLGTFANYYRQPGDPNPQDRQLVEIVTRTAALAIERVRARDALRKSEQTARFLADASAALAVLVDFDSTLQKVSSLAVPSFADWATVDLAEGDGTLRRVAVAHADPAKVELAHELHRRFPPDPAAPQGVWNVLRTGRAEIVPEITDELLVRSTGDADLLRIVRELGLKSYIGVPLKVRGKALGVITFVAAESGRRYDDADLATAQDLADRAAIAVENAQLYRELRDADRRKDEFLATLAHELRNPLAPIRNGLQVLRLSGPEKGVAAEARSMMERQLSQMVRLVDDLLDVSRISRNKLDLKRQRVALAAVVHSAVETSRPLVEQARHTLVVTLPPGPVDLDADLVRLAQVFSNLLNNSAKYTEPGGHIWLTAEVSGHEVAVRVRDTGLGIPADALPRIFEMFSQVDRNMERAQGGLGIGLTLVRRLVEMHGGTVEARSDGPGRGSEFTVRLPVLKDEAAGQQGPTTGDGSAASVKRRILIVDDNQDSAMSLGMMLDLMGNQTRTAHDGLAAVEAAEQFRPDIILLDIGLPKLNGYDACRRIREQPWSNGMVIVALTGWGQEEDRRRSQEAGFNHHLVKPVDMAALEKVLGES